MWRAAWAAPADERVWRGALGGVEESAGGAVGRQDRLDGWHPCGVHAPDRLVEDQTGLLSEGCRVELPGVGEAAYKRSTSRREPAALRRPHVRTCGRMGVRATNDRQLTPKKRGRASCRGGGPCSPEPNHLPGRWTPAHSLGRLSSSSNQIPTGLLQSGSSGRGSGRGAGGWPGSRGPGGSGGVGGFGQGGRDGSGQCPARCLPRHLQSR